MDLPFNNTISDALQAIENAPSILKVTEAFRGFAEAYGYTHFLCSAPPLPDEDPFSPLLFERWPDVWLERYVGRRYFEQDPMVRQLFRTPHPFVWSEVMKAGDHSKEALTIMSEAAECGMVEGFVVPVFGVGGKAHVVTMSGAKVRFDPTARKELHLVSMYAYARAMKLRKRSEPPVIQLSPRQTEALQWAAMGKTDSEIGDIMGVTENTAHKHIEEAKRRFGVATRMQAVVAAIRQGGIRI